MRKGCVKSVLFIFFLIIMLRCPFVFAGEDSALLNDARDYAARKNYACAYMSLRSLATSFNESRYLADTLLAMGEYNYYDANYSDCSRILTEFISRYPDNDNKIFAYAYLLSIAKASNDMQMTARLERSIVSFMKVSLLFRDYKAYQYRSLLLRRYKAIYYIDKVEIYVDGKILAKFAY
jgi:outer membrane protein assembly factor BamD (BamD/ComL family)